MRTKLLAMFTGALLMSLPAVGEVMLQWFESDWDEMYRRMPEVAEIGYDYIWAPPPTKAPTGKGTIWANVGYNLYDRFDVGQVPQRGSLATRYGTKGALQNMVKKAHQVDVKIIPDIVMNHNGNGPDFREYPGMVPEDFHVEWQEGYVNTLNYKRGPRMDQWTADNGFGGTMWMELAQLIDIKTEDAVDPNRFVGGNNTPGYSFVAGTEFLRHPSQPQYYPYYPAGYTNENTSELLNRWITWLGNEMDYDGLRIDAGKHTPHEFFGTLGNGFLHEAQWNYNQRRGYSDGNSAEADELFENYLSERDDALLFAEILSPWSEIEYWYGYGQNDRNPMRFLDYAMKKHADNKFNGDLNGLGAFGSDFGPTNGILYVWGHDEGGPAKINLAYAYILTHVGMPMVYFTGNNIVWDDHGREAYPNARTWMIPGYDAAALADQNNILANLVWIHQQFAWGAEEKLWELDGDYFALERYSDVDSNGRDSGDALMIMAMNDSGWDQTRTLSSSFESGTVLKDYTGNNLSDATVGSGGSVDITVPGNGGEGWVVYAPKIADPLNVSFSGSSVDTIDWVVPGGVHADDKNRTFTRINGTNFTINVNFGTPGGAVDNVMMKWGKGDQQLIGNTHYTNDNSHVVGNFEELTQVNATSWTATINIDADNVPEGINVVKIRAFNQRTIGSYPALYNTATEVVYVDREGPSLDVNTPEEGETIYGDAVMVISNADFLAYGMTVSVNGGAPETAHEIMKGQWKYALNGLSAGTHTAVISATEADWAASRAIINTSTFTRTFNIATGSVISLSHGDGAEIQLPFFKTGVNAPGAADVRLYWNGLRLPFNAGVYTNTFEGSFVYDLDPANIVTDRLWGAFINGQHFFEAVRVDGSVTSRAVSRVLFNMYGGNHIDSDGDAIPDNVEMPFFDDGAPGPDQAWPGDDNDFVPEWGENWTKLNPYNHSTFYSGQWDDQNDFDGDGKSNYEEVYAGYVEDGNIYKYNIYDGGSTPTGTPSQLSSASWSPSNGVARGAALTVNYVAASGSLASATQVVMHVGHSGKSEASWQDVINTNMTSLGGGQWQAVYTVPTNATSVDFTFWDGDGLWDSKDWQAVVTISTSYFFVMDGALDSGNFVIHDSGMYIHAAARGENIYVATWAVSESSGGNDHFIYVTDQLGEASDLAQGWSKSGVVFVDTSAKPVLTAEGENDWEAWNNVNGQTANDPGAGNTLEGEFNMLDAFGSVPEAVYVAAISIGTGDSGTINSQGPFHWDTQDENLTITEFLRVPISSIRDDNEDGVFDGGKPEMWTVVDGSTNDANYGMRRFFLDELAGDSESITVIIQPNAGTNAVTDVELFSNLNRRDFAQLPGDEDPDSVTTSSQDTYFRAYTMTNNGDGTYSYTLSLDKCGAYRINARYRVNGGSYRYYTDNGLRRDTAVIASPKKALELVMYELNPLFAEATDDTFYGRSTFEDMYTYNTNKPDVINPAYLTNLGVNMLWLQPIHPIGSDNRDTDPSTGQPYDPGSPYAVRNYWKVNSILGNPSSNDEAMREFTNFVTEMDNVGVGVMLDGTFNHSAWDCEIGSEGQQMFSWATNNTDLIREIRPEWYSKRDSYGEHAGYYFSGNNTDIAAAPDRIDFGKWNDAADFFFGRYDALVQQAPANTNWAWSSPWYSRYLMEEDRFEGFETNYTKHLWQYFAEYPLYWLEKSGHPAGTPKWESHKGIDGLRCDFAQGLPSLFWEYTINRTRSVKWDFLFMAESLDGFREVNNSKRHGVGYRSARHFDILNENMVFTWRDTYFDYFGGGASANPTTTPLIDAFEDRRDAFDSSPILLNISSHDEIYPSDAQWRLVYAYAILAAIDGVPMIHYGQEAGAQNDVNTYGGGIDAGNNWGRYETNFGKAIPHFKRYNHLTNIWNNLDSWAVDLNATYQRVGQAREQSPALQSLNRYFLSETNGSRNEEIFAVAKFEQPGVSASSQDVVFAFINHNYEASTNRAATFDVDADYNGNNWFGIEAGKSYNIVDLISTNPTTYIWGTDRTGSDILQNGIFIWLNQSPFAGKQAQFLKLVDTAVGPNYPDQDGDGIPDSADPDDDNDGLPDWWEEQNGLDPLNAAGNDGASGDGDGDQASNFNEFLSQTSPTNGSDHLFAQISWSNGNANVSWPAKVNVNYYMEASGLINPPTWQTLFFGTALDTQEEMADNASSGMTSRFYRVRVKP